MNDTLKKNAIFLSGAIVAVIFSFLYYSRLLASFFTGADTLWQIDDSRISSFGDLGRILTEPMLGHDYYIGGGIFYRPLTSLMRSLDYAIWNINPYGYHLTDLLLHLTVVALIFWLIRILFNSNAAAWLGAGIFLVHPSVSRSLGGPAGAGDILMSACFLFAFITFVLYLNRRRRFILSISLVAYAFALFSKETAFFLWPLMFLYVLLFQGKGEDIRNRAILAIRNSWPYIGLAVIFFLIRLLVLQGIGGYQHENQNLMNSVISSIDMTKTFFMNLLRPAYGLSNQTNSLVIWISLFVLCFVSSIMYFFSLFLITKLLLDRKYSLIALSSLIPLVLLTVMIILRMLSDISLLGMVYQIFLIALIASLVCLINIAITFKSAIIEHFKTTSRLKLYLFLLIWMIIPLGVSLSTRAFNTYNMYFPSIPFCIILANALVDLISVRYEQNSDVLKTARRPLLFARASAVFIILIISVSSFNATSRMSDLKMTELFLVKITDTASLIPDSGQIDVYNFPNAIFSLERNQKVSEYNIRCWLNIALPENKVRVNIKTFDGSDEYPQQLFFDDNWEDKNHVSLYVQQSY
ncbi:MAG: hypothetical protein WC911_10150 [Thermoleophilia bacterium]